MNDDVILKNNKGDRRRHHLYVPVPGTYRYLVPTYAFVRVQYLCTTGVPGTVYVCCLCSLLSVVARLWQGCGCLFCLALKRERHRYPWRHACRICAGMYVCTSYAGYVARRASRQKTPFDRASQIFIRTKDKPMSRAPTNKTQNNNAKYGKEQKATVPVPLSQYGTLSYPSSSIDSFTTGPSLQYACPLSRKL